jgi:obg-like ATPase 1
VRDLDIISDELRLKDIATMERALGDIERPYLRGEKKYKTEYVSELFYFP